MIVKRLFVASINAAALSALLAAPSLTAAPPATTAAPDFTQGDQVPEGETHDWNLGARRITTAVRLSSRPNQQTSLASPKVALSN
jgi:hypothetical protein